MQIQKIKKSISDISVKLSFTSCNYTVGQKMIMCDAFMETAEEFPEEMEQYLLEGARRYNLQNKIFKKYIDLVQRSFPMSFVKGGKRHTIKSLEDSDLNLFCGKQTFNEVVDKNGKIKNNTGEIYIGGRKSSIVKPYYIGKLINVVDSSTGMSILKSVEDYTFTWIKTKNIKPGTAVEVEHLAVPPHYQMGPMVYLNRIKTEIKKSL